MSHLKPLTITWSSGRGGQFGRFAHRGSNHLPFLSTSTAALFTRSPARSRVAGKVFSEADQSRRTPSDHVLPQTRLAGPALLSLSSLLLLCQGLWFGISFLSQLEPQQPPAWLLKILVRKIPQRVGGPFRIKASL